MSNSPERQPVPRSWRRWIAVAVILALALSLALFVLTTDKRTRSALNTEILVLGDSQLSFGAGPVLSRFFTNLQQQCSSEVESRAELGLFADKRFAMIGTRSTSLQSWTSNQGRAWELLCHKDKKWGVNASTWGTVKPIKKRYVQIGEGDNFQFCNPPETPLQNLFASGYYSPQLLMIFVGGNGAGRLARSLSAAKHDVSRFIAHLPDNTGCVFMMTAPIYSQSHNSTRRLAQENLRAAFATHGNRCTFVEGHTPPTRAAIEGQAHFFRRDKFGKLKDPYHANEAAAAKFLELRRGPLCRALIGQMRTRS